MPLICRRSALNARPCGHGHACFLDRRERPHASRACSLLIRYCPHTGRQGGRPEGSQGGFRKALPKGEEGDPGCPRRIQTPFHGFNDKEAALKAKAALDADTVCVECLAPYVNRRASVLGLPAAQIQQQRTGRRPFEQQHLGFHCITIRVHQWEGNTGHGVRPAQ